MDFLREINYKIEQQRQIVHNNFSIMTPEQSTIFRDFISIVVNHENSILNDKNMLFLDAPGGTGKTFVINSILAAIRGEVKIVLATSTSGIAATLLSGGRTVHSTFEIPLNTLLIYDTVLFYIF